MERTGWAGLRRRAAALAAAAMIAGAAAAETAATHVLGNLVYAVPEGYVAVGGETGVMMARRDDLADGAIDGMILLAPEIRPDAALWARLSAVPRAEAVQAVAIATGNVAGDPSARMSPAEIINDMRKDGFDAWRVVTVTEDADAGRRRYSVVVVAFAGELVHVLSANGWGSEAALGDVLPGFEAVLASGGFLNRGAAAPAVPAPPLPRDFAAVMPKRAAGGGGAGGGGGGGSRTVQRQMCSGGFASGMGYFCNTYPQRVCN